MDRNEAVVNEICSYAEDKDIHGLLKEYMRRLIVEQPDEPLKFLIASITENPYVPPKKETEVVTDETPKEPETSSAPTFMP